MSGHSPVDALVVVDLQRGLVDGATAVPGAAEVVQAVGALLGAARDAGAVVVHLQNDGGKDAPDEPQTSGWELVLTPRSDEPVLRKSEDDPFLQTELESVLRAAGVRRLAVCGLLAEMCVAATARGALARGFEVVLPRDARGTYDVPSDGSAAPAVPAELVARVAEWSLGDQVELPDRSTDVAFTRASR